MNAEFNEQRIDESGSPAVEGIVGPVGEWSHFVGTPCKLPGEIFKLQLARMHALRTCNLPMHV